MYCRSKYIWKVKNSDLEDVIMFLWQYVLRKTKSLPTARLELAIFRLGVRRLIHWATQAVQTAQHLIYTDPAVWKQIQWKSAKEAFVWGSVTKPWPEIQVAWYLNSKKKKNIWPRRDLNTQPSDLESDALPLRHGVSYLFTLSKALRKFFCLLAMRLRDFCI